MKKYLFFVLFFISSNVSAQPDIALISGSFANNQSVIVNGTAFGSHLLNIDFIGPEIEAASTGKMSDFGNWTMDGGGTAVVPEVSTSQVHSGTKALYQDMGTMSGGMYRYTYPSTIGYDEDVFISWWTRRNRTGTHNYQWKLFRVGYSPDSYLDTYTPQFKWFEHDGSYNEFFVNPGPGTNPSNGGPPYPEDYLKTSFPSQDDRWYRIDILMHTSSSQGAADGYYNLRLYDPTGGFISEHSSSGWVTFNTGSNDYYKYFFWQNWNETSSITSHKLWSDDHYIQIGTQARVELCNASTWAARTSCDIQEPSSWSNTSITATINTGAFNLNETAYLYVIDADGIVSNDGQGVSVIVKGEAGSYIAPPLNLRVIEVDP